MHTHKLYPQLSVAPVVVAARRGVPVVQTLHDFEMLGASPIDVRGGWWDRDEPRLRHKLLQLGDGAAPPAGARGPGLLLRRRLALRPASTPGVGSSPSSSRTSSALSGTATRTPGYAARDGVLFLGRLRPEKGVDVVELARKLPDVRVTMVGTGDLEEWARSEAASMDNLEITGFVTDPELASIVEGARVMVVPSRCQDAGPLVPLESMAAGTPVVAYANGGLGEYVADAGGGRVVPQDVVALADAAREIHDDAKLWAALSSRGRQSVAERHGGRVRREPREGLRGRSRMTGTQDGSVTLVTGGAGYVGSVLVADLLDRGRRVRVLDSLAVGDGSSLLPLWGRDGFEFVKGDVRDPAARATALQGVVEVVHLAAIVGDPACARDPEAATAVNLEASRALVDEALDAGASRFVFASTCSNYGKLEDPSAYATEDWELRPVSLYAETKVAAELDILARSSERASTTCLRFATVYGPSPRMRFSLTVNEFARDAVRTGELVVYGEQFWRPYVHVRDAAGP